MIKCVFIGITITNEQFVFEFSYDAIDQDSLDIDSIAEKQKHKHK